ncbi:16S rRNA (uracil(1498)-N(3))-methyltransferase [Acetobacteraceae bacterium]|nr:16S rRNA (uracil(1498)-N(3))-methyltransferase [Acetobacteraceae bacterium]
MKKILKPHLLPRLFLASQGQMDICLEQGKDICLQKDQAHYLSNVLRRKVGDYCRFFDGKNGEWLGKITFLKRYEIHIEIQSQLRKQEYLKRPKQLLFSPLKRDATELVIRMGTELGVERFRPLVMARTNVHKLNYERLHAIAVEASEQSERLDVPEILPLSPMCVTLAQWSQNTPILVALERESGLSSNVQKGLSSVLIGPEGGFSKEEKEQILKNSFCYPISLGEQVLRADTAIIATLSYLNRED